MVAIFICQGRIVKQSKPNSSSPTYYSNGAPECVALVDNHDQIKSKLRIHNKSDVFNPLKVLYTNADQSDQFLNKRDDNKPDVIMITEILPKTQLNFISEAQLNILGFTLFTNFPLNCDLSNATTGHGVVIYLSQKLKAALQL